MARRLMKALEDLSLHYDGSVRNAHGGIVQVARAARAPAAATPRTHAAPRAQDGPTPL